MLVPVFLAVSVVIFLILHLIPGDPIDNLLKVGSVARGARARSRRAMGWTGPCRCNTCIWLGKVLQGDLGTAIVGPPPGAAT